MNILTKLLDSADYPPTLGYDGSHICTALIAEQILIRRTEYKLLDLYKSGKIDGTIHTCVGQEATPVFLAEFITAEDYVFSNHRCHGHYLAATKDYFGLFSEMIGSSLGASKGLGGSQHLTNGKFFSNGVQGGLVPVSCGVAYSLKHKNLDSISVSFIGDGTLGQGIVYETLNIASLWAVPLLVILENNHIAQSTSEAQNLAGSISARASAFGVKYFSGSTMKPHALRETLRQAVEYTRQFKRPAFVEVDCQRLLSHSKGDDNRSIDCIQFYASNDTLNRLVTSGDKTVSLLIENADQILSLLIEDVLRSASVSEVPIQSSSKIEVLFDSLTASHSEDRYNKEIYSCLAECLATLDNALLLGQDIMYRTLENPGEYGGAFKVTMDLSDRFPGRVLNTPISEAACTGIVTGMSLSGLYPIFEIMFGDFLPLAFDQLVNQCSKIVSMYGSKISLPLILRTPMGGGRGYGPTHSQSLEKFVLGIPNLCLVALNHRLDPSLIYNLGLPKIQIPTIVIESKRLYNSYRGKELQIGYNYYSSKCTFPIIKISPSFELNKPICTIACYGEILEDVEAALDLLLIDHELTAEVLCYSSLSNSILEPLISSVANTGRLLIAEIGTSVASWGSQIIADVTMETSKQHKVIRVSNNELIPAGLAAEKKRSVTPTKIVTAIIDSL